MTDTNVTARDGTYRAKCVCGWSIQRDARAANLPAENNERIVRKVADVHENRPRFGSQAEEVHEVSFNAGLLVTDGGSDRQLVICKNCGDEHYLDERKHRSASSFCPECRMRGGYVLDDYREEHKDKIRTDGGTGGRYQMGPNVLLSIDPEWADAILDGEKRYEYRRVVPAKEAPMRFVLYASAPVQAAVGEVWSWKILRDQPIEELLDDTVRWTPHSREDVRVYFEGVDTGNAIRIASSYRFDTPVPRSDLVEMDLEPGQNFRYIGEAPAHPPESYDLEQIRVEEPGVSVP